MVHQNAENYLNKLWRNFYYFTQFEVAKDCTSTLQNIFKTLWKSAELCIKDKAKHRYSMPVNFGPSNCIKNMPESFWELHPQTQVKGLSLQISPIWTWSRNHAVFCYYTITDMKQWKTNTFNNSEIWDHRETWNLWNTPPKKPVTQTTFNV